LSATKKRPVIIISNDLINQQSFIVAKITSVVHKDIFSFTLDNSNLSIPLPKPSEVRTHQLFTAHRSLILKKFSQLDKQALTRLTEMIINHISV